MKIRSLLILTALASSILGAIVVYLVLSVPNDIRADGLLKQAREQMSAGENDKARESLSKIIQQYPRTDAASAAHVALLSLVERDRDDLARAITVLRQQNEQQAVLLRNLQKSVQELKDKPPPPPVTVTAPKPPAKTPPAKKRTPPRRRRR